MDVSYSVFFPNAGTKTLQKHSCVKLNLIVLIRNGPSTRPIESMSIKSFTV